MQPHLRYFRSMSTMCYFLLYFSQRTDFLVCFTAGLSIRGNQLTGSLESLCNARDERRDQFASYLALNLEADCLEDPPEVICSCCTCF